jgi:hypothetical protein
VRPILGAHIYPALGRTLSGQELFAAGQTRAKHVI